MEQWDGVPHGWLALPFRLTHSCPAVSGQTEYTARVRPGAHEGPHHTHVRTPDKPYDTCVETPQKLAAKGCGLEIPPRPGWIFCIVWFGTYFHTRLTYTRHTPPSVKEMSKHVKRGHRTVADSSLCFSACTLHHRKAIFRCLPSPAQKYQRLFCE